jgi:4-cresol dehydrogenase (hydroxylating)
MMAQPSVSPAALRRALAAFERIVGRDHVYADAEGRQGYVDAFSPFDDPAARLPLAGVAPASVEEIQAIVRLAGEHGVALWPISRGKNLGYGGASPRIPGVVMLDLARMNRIVEVDADMGYAIVEPGVGFDDLYAYLIEHDIPLWMSAAAHTWGSVMGNALERGVGYTPYGEHSAQVCGLEVVLPSGELARTGMGAMPGSKAWPLFKHGFGPGWDSMFMQSNFGIVTKMGLWLMPAPEATLNLTMKLPRVEDLPVAVEALRPLRLSGVVQANPSFGNAIRSLSTRDIRSAYWQGSGVMPQEAIDAAVAKAGLGQWNFNVRLFGHEKVNEINAGLVRDAFAKATKVEFEETRWHRGEDLRTSGAAVPTLGALRVVDWLGGPGGHLTFSPVSAFSGDEAWNQYRTIRSLYEGHGFDYYGGFTAGARYLNHISMIIFNRDDPAMTGRARNLFKALIAVAATNGWGEYRTHVHWYDEIADTYSFNNGALGRMNEAVKDALDPKGILAPGKMGIWPRRYRDDA